ncbi:MAG: hypothetical protein M1816_005938 [Peltula sp. TS41687]|nr:MAG: hypothetical protein M1816_005938 [Peltula sp. TS41687]
MVLDRRQNIETARKDLKHKLSTIDTLVDAKSDEYLKLKIEEVELEKAEEEVNRIQLTFEKKEMEPRSFRAKRRDADKRIISLGDDLWRLKRNLREVEEKAGKIATLTPDSDHAFTATLLHLYKDPATTRKRSRAMQANMRREAIEVYSALPREGEKEMPPKDWARCTLTGKYYMSPLVKAAHIVPASIGVEIASYIFGAEAGARLFSADNCLMLYYMIEQAFDNANLVFVPVDPNARPILRWKAALINEDARQQQLGIPEYPTLGHLDGKELEFRTNHRPAARFLYYHFIVSLLRCRQYDRTGWQDAWTRYRTRTPWPTPCPYLRRSMLLTLARATGDVEESEVEHLFHKETFEAEQKLSQDAEEEIARRTLAVGLKQEEKADKLQEGVKVENESDEESD